MKFLLVASIGLSLLNVSLCQHDSDDPLAWLRNSIPGEPGVDYPILVNTQETSFSCDGLTFGGYYADPEMDCQGYHVCLADPINADNMYPVSFLCPNGTIFNQELFNCDWWYNVDCAASTSLYSLAEGAFGTAGGAGGEGGDGGQCPAADAGSDAECEGRSSNCWSPGQRDTDCPNSGLCCFDGCANTCVDAPPPQIADDSRPVPDVVATTTAGYEYEVPEVTLPIRPVTTAAPIPVTTPAALYGAPPQRRQGRQRNNRRSNQRQRNNRRGRRQRRPTGNYVFV
jgi:hypothetical protein